MQYDKIIVDKVCHTLVNAGSTFSHEKVAVYKNAIATESNAYARWAMETILKNAEVAEKNKSPLCDDTGIPHLVLDVGPDSTITGNMLESIKEGVRQGLRTLPGRPMAVKGNARQRIDQSLGMDEDPGALLPAPILIRNIDENVVRLHVLMFGGGPAIRGKTYRIFHQHSVDVVLDEIVNWATEGSALLGCSPCTIAIGIGRSHYEASSMMLQALVDGKYGEQSDLEKSITSKINASNVGPLGLGGNHTVLGTFMKVGPQRSSGVRIVCMRPCCCFEPRIASVEL